MISTGTSPNTRLSRGANTLEINSGNDLIWTGSKVGLNEASPDALLHLKNIAAQGISAGIKLESSGTSNSANDTVGRIEFAHNDANDPGVSAVIACKAEDAAGNTYLEFSNGNPSAAGEKLRITSAGSVIPGSNTNQNLGGNTLRWQNVYAQSYVFNDGGGRIDYNTTANTMEFVIGGDQQAEFTDGSFVPVSSADNIALGTTAKRWGTIRGQALDINGATSPAVIEHTGGAAVVFRRNSKDISINANYSAANTHSAIELTSGMDLAFYLGGAERTRMESDGEVRFVGQVRITEERPYFRLISSAPFSNNDPRAVMNFESQNSNNDEDMYRINFWEGNSSGETGNANQSIRYNGSPNDGGDGSIRFVQENGNINFFVSRNGNGGIQGTLTQNTSDIRLKENITPIENALEKVSSLSGFTYTWNQEAKDAGLRGDEHECLQVGVSAQDVQKVQPEAVKPSPVNRQKYITVQYERLVPLLIEAIKELKEEVEELKRTK